LIRKIASDTQERVSLYKSRKASLPNSTFYTAKSTLKSFKSKDSDSDSVIALTTVETNKTGMSTGGNAKPDRWNRESTYGGAREDDPWSPTVTMGKASVQKVINVQMVNGRGSPAPQPNGRRYI
jgi:hypothetical protein